jgi:glucose dehydrogenase
LCGPPPWGELVALDLAGGKIVWRQPLGRMEEPFPNLPKSAEGSLILGGPIVTAGGLIFMGGTMDPSISGPLVGYWQGALVCCSPRQRTRAPDHLRSRWQAVRGDRCWR